ncbi:MAG TPA: hypothetical protein VF414_13580, partial [Thermoanaerobaculia bacterium]
MSRQEQKRILHSVDHGGRSVKDLDCAFGIARIEGRDGFADQCSSLEMGVTQLPKDLLHLISRFEGSLELPLKRAESRQPREHAAPEPRRAGSRL